VQGSSGLVQEARSQESYGTTDQQRLSASGPQQQRDWAGWWAGTCAHLVLQYHRNSNLPSWRLSVCSCSQHKWHAVWQQILRGDAQKMQMTRGQTGQCQDGRAAHAAGPAFNPKPRPAVERVRMSRQVYVPCTVQVWHGREVGRGQQRGWVLTGKAEGAAGGAPA